MTMTETLPDFGHGDFLESCRAAVVRRYLRDWAAGATDSVVLLLDLHDDAARSILETSGWGGDEIDAAAAELTRLGAIPFGLWSLPPRDVGALFDAAWPGLAGELAAPGPGDGFFTVVVAAGSATLHWVEVLGVSAPRPASNP
jgi:hypothetical protein